MTTEICGFEDCACRVYPMAHEVVQRASAKAEVKVEVRPNPLPLPGRSEIVHFRLEENGKLVVVK